MVPGGERQYCPKHWRKFSPYPCFESVDACLAVCSDAVLVSCVLMGGDGIRGIGGAGVDWPAVGRLDKSPEDMTVILDLSNVSSHRDQLSTAYDPTG